MVYNFRAQLSCSVQEKKLQEERVVFFGHRNFSEVVVELSHVIPWNILKNFSFKRENLFFF